MTSTSAPQIDIDVANLPAVVRRNERTVRRSFWKKVAKVIGRIPFADDLLSVYYCAIDHRTPPRVRGVLFAALAYFVLPTDMIPDFIAAFGFTDDATVIATTLGIVGSHVKNRHKERARRVLDLPLHAED